MEEIAPLKYAGSWDNVGLILESQRNPSKILLTIDLTESVYKEALEKDISLILAYHPPWFRGEKSLTLDPSRGIMRIVTLCASSGISIYSPHSALDAIPRGINQHVSRIITLNAVCRMEPIEIQENGIGAGRIIELESELPLQKIIDNWMNYSKIPSLRIALPPKTSIDQVKVKRVAVCVGSGASLFKNISADLYFTGELSHHDLLALAQSSVILTEHSNCERGYLADVLAPWLRDELGSEFKVYVSTNDVDPVTIIHQKVVF
jgi:dinuclear metal center YbgI/SA1388 family protein